MKARTKFRKWVARQQAAKSAQKRRTRTEIAASLGCSEAALCRYLKDGDVPGARVPDGRIACAIEAATDGWIKASEWYSEPRRSKGEAA